MRFMGSGLVLTDVLTGHELASERGLQSAGPLVVERGRHSHARWSAQGSCGLKSAPRFMGRETRSRRKNCPVTLGPSAGLDDDFPLPKGEGQGEGEERAVRPRAPGRFRSYRTRGVPQLKFSPEE